MVAFESAWPKVAIVTLVLIAPLGAVTGKRMRLIRRISSESSAMNSELLRRSKDSFLKISLGVRIAVFLGIVLLTSANFVQR